MSNVFAKGRSRSPSLSFEPSPAITMDEKNFLSSENVNETNLTSYPGSIGRAAKEVHFSPVDPVVRRAQSLATTVPLLEPVSSASQLPSYNFKSVTSSIDMDAYVQQSRAILQTQRLNFERERKVFEEERKLFEGERKLWSTERALLKAKIIDLEAAVAESKGDKRRYSHASTKSSSQSLRSSSFTSAGGSRASFTSNTSPPIWEGPENTAPASRVFSEPNTLTMNPFTEDQTKRANGHLPSISENGSCPALQKEISPSSIPPDRVTSVPIPIDKIDKSLDGITLKSSALAPSFVAKVMTPDAVTPRRSPSPNSKSAGGTGLRVGMDALLSPLDEKLKLHAGHTPMAFDTASSTGPTSEQSTEIPTPVQEKPPAPAPTACPPPPRPTEKSDSYFSFTADEHPEPKTNDEGEEKENEDPEMTGPLALSSNNEHGESNAFLNTLDAKLMMEAKRYVKSPESTQSDDSDHSAALGGTQDEEGPRLRMKNSMNFGSAFGSNRCGNI
jgi:hypothetical protein